MCYCKTGIIVLLTGLLLPAALWGQAKWQYAGMVQGGLVAGASQSTYTLQTVQGLRHGQWMAGIGAGIDNYMVPGFPVVAHGQYRFKKSGRSSLLYIQGGPHFPWAKNQWDAGDTQAPFYQLQTGWLAEAGLGHQWPLGKRLHIFGMLGYSVKQTPYLERLIWFIPGPGPVPPPGWENAISHVLTTQRVVLKAGIGW